MHCKDEYLNILPLEQQKSIISTNHNFNDWNSRQLRREIDRIIQTQVNYVHLIPHLKGGKVMELAPAQPAENEATKDDAGKDDEEYGHEDEGWYDYDENGDEFWTNGYDVEYSQSHGSINVVYSKGKCKRKGKGKKGKRIQW